MFNLPKIVTSSSLAAICPVWASLQDDAQSGFRRLNLFFLPVQGTVFLRPKPTQPIAFKFSTDWIQIRSSTILSNLFIRSNLLICLTWSFNSKFKTVLCAYLLGIRWIRLFWGTRREILPNLLQWPQIMSSNVAVAPRLTSHLISKIRIPFRFRIYPLD